MKGSGSEICTGPSVRGLDPWRMKGGSSGVWRVGAGHRVPFTACFESMCGFPVKRLMQTLQARETQDTEAMASQSQGCWRPGSAGTSNNPEPSEMHVTYS